MGALLPTPASVTALACVEWAPRPSGLRHGQMGKECLLPTITHHTHRAPGGGARAKGKVNALEDRTHQAQNDARNAGSNLTINLQMHRKITCCCTAPFT